MVYGIGKNVFENRRTAAQKSEQKLEKHTAPLPLCLLTLLPSYPLRAAYCLMAIPSQQRGELEGRRKRLLERKTATCSRNDEVTHCLAEK